MNKTLIIVSVLMAAALTGIFSTTTAIVYADESETNTEQEIKQKNVGSGESTQFNCAENNINEEASPIDVDLCGTAAIDIADLIGDMAAP